MNHSFHLFHTLAFAVLLFALAGCGDPSSVSSAPGESVFSDSGAAERLAVPAPEGSEEMPATPQSDAEEPRTAGEELRLAENGIDGTIPIAIRIGEKTFSAGLCDNGTSRALAERLPLTLTMSELHGNEKYFYLEEELPVDSETPGQIRAGDLMLFGGDCLVLFYESFSSACSYTPLGALDDPAGLAQAVGTGSVTVTFEAA